MQYRPQMCRVYTRKILEKSGSWVNSVGIQHEVEVWPDAQRWNELRGNTNKEEQRVPKRLSVTQIRCPL